MVIVIASDTTTPRADPGPLAGCLEAFARQVDAPETELIVPVHDAVDGVEELSRRYPDVRFLHVEGPKEPSSTGPRVHHYRLRARGLLEARGELLALAEDHARPDPHWCANLVAAHRAGRFAGVGGALENGVDRPLQWAVYFSDYAAYQNPVPEGESTRASDNNVAYRREALLSVRDCWADGFHEVIVNGALTRRGEKLVLRRDVVMVQQREALRLGSALRERFVWGRQYAEIRCAALRGPRRWLLLVLSPLLPLLLTARIARLAVGRGRGAKFLAVLPLVLALETAWSLGEAAGYWRGASLRPLSPRS